MGAQLNESSAVAQGMYDPRFEHDNCGIGAVVNIKGVKSHATVENALKIVENLKHRAGKDAEGKTGDGVGILLQISHKFFTKAVKPLGISLGGERDYGIGMFFFPQDELARNQAKKMFEVIIDKEGMEFLGWREVPIDPTKLGKKAVDCMPYIMQAFVKRPKDVAKGLDFDRKLYVARRVFEQSNDNTYVVSLSSRTIVYKGMFLVDQLRLFFADLQDKDYESAIAMVHSRFSTNTNPSWERAHPNRFIVHNGEINTIRGNADKMLAREETMESEHLKGELQKVLPVVNTEGSDSAMLDNTLEFLVMSGMDLPLAVMIMIPEPWSNNALMAQNKKDFYQYYATMMEPWDGPASIVFSDGDKMGAVLDRNGLRPSRYYITDDDQLILSSEVGVLDIDPTKIVVKERLRPGKMLLVDTVEGRVIDDEELKNYYASKQPYGEWLDRNLIQLKDLKIPNERVPEYTKEERQKMQKAFGYTYESLKDVILPMAKNGVEGTAAMGIDTSLAVLSGDRQPLFNYFKQLFAQVTNPPIDSIREKVVTSTTVYIGEDGNLLEEKPINCQVLKVNNPILTNTDIMKIKTMKVEGFKVVVLPIIYYKNTSLEKAIEHLYVEADRAYRDGANILILSDRGVDENHVPIPSLLAVAALQQHLVSTKKRTAVAMILESGEPREVHHFATLLGYGACAINPYLAQDTVKQLVDEHMLDKDYYAAIDDYNKAIINGIVKIASKMGISTIQSYQGSKIFEAIGIDKEVIDKYFTNTVSRIGGITLDDIQKNVNALHSEAYDPLGLETDLTLDSVGRHKMRSGADQHIYNPQTIHLLQQSTKLGDYKMFKEYTDLVDSEERHMNIRGLLDFEYPRKGIPLEEVESVDSIVTRFKTGAMSYGSISKEAHETLAIAMNHLHGKSNTGEGGEDPERIASKNSKVNRCSAIKQVASGRFGVTSRYLVSAEEIQIKMAQGAKPGEGGHLPGKKVYPWIAKTRLSTPGVALISPPPHHDIYSIEDLEQLIYDLKNSNRDARISVKLVSEAGVGTVAAGVAKAGAQVVLISGYDGGTGAAPQSSIHNAGLPWELGLAETHQTLIMNGLRNKVRIETDGKLMSGRDVAIAALLGAEEFGFATAPLVTMGCVMMRVCNLDTCPAGIATQNPELRKRFAGKPEYVENFMRFIAEELREYMAKLGFRTVDEMVGRSDLLKVRDDLTDREKEIDLSKILHNPFADTKKKVIFDPKQVYDFELEKTKDEKILLKQLASALEKGERRSIDVEVTNTDRSFGTIFGSEITKRYDDTLDEDTFIVKCNGAGGQSFGAFIPKGLTLELVGDSNDYFGKGLSGGKLVVYPPAGVKFKKDENIVIGNVALYGATSGKAFINGVAGERFCVRNSGATAVVEGVGDHGCEYMTGGRVVILGKTGKNFAAGMSGGIAYVLDEDNDLYTRMNKEMVFSEEVSSKYDVLELKDMIKEHVALTNSEKGKQILDNFSEYLPKFKKIIPYDYNRMMNAIVQMEEKGLSSEQAQIEAFYANTNN
ncbi:MAG: glutamate synthase large subunit [Lachnospiraceae bacterium]|uniref:glutamate synthase large subunit n=1 Tax=Roseburia hominis TaxID=301301 RepID=UPI001F32999A|nr:glutamate synthase large subunit [Roseburia hominis]MCI5713415.1 glutamate synthase large subunit [Lachnospiraceae bacterium]MDD6168695.1 glutamate synthase large subunit [Lachnospiraceae bacterium]MDY4839314.1 glutamate synthase large subunit [Lachnospiraceae bacterium]